MVVLQKQGEEEQGTKFGHGEQAERQMKFGYKGCLFVAQTCLAVLVRYLGLPGMSIAWHSQLAATVVPC